MAGDAYNDLAKRPRTKQLVEATTRKEWTSHVTSGNLSRLTPLTGVKHSSGREYTKRLPTIPRLPADPHLCLTTDSFRFVLLLFPRVFLGATELGSPAVCPRPSRLDAVNIVMSAPGDG